MVPDVPKRVMSTTPGRIGGSRRRDYRQNHTGVQLDRVFHNTPCNLEREEVWS